MCADVAESLMAASNGPDAADSVHLVVDRWIRFMDRRSARLSTSEVKGLIGELNVLDRLIVNSGAQLALEYWKSPSGSIRDFELATASVEVKAFTPSEGASVRINDPYQLEPDFDVPLHLACIEISRSESSETTLPGHIARIESRLEANPKALSLFRDKLLEAGYADWQSNLYLDRWKTGKLYIFTVQPGFPRIEPSTIPEGVETVRFSLEVAKLHRYSTACDSLS